MHTPFEVYPPSYFFHTHTHIQKEREREKQKKKSIKIYSLEQRFSHFLILFVVFFFFFFLFPSESPSIPFMWQEFSVKTAHEIKRNKATKKITWNTTHGMYKLWENLMLEQLKPLAPKLFLSSINGSIMSAACMVDNPVCSYEQNRRL